MPKLPERFANNPALVAAVVEARQVELDTRDPAFAIEWLLEHSDMSVDSATRAIQDQTFRYPALYPAGHPGLDALMAEQRARSRRAYRLKKLRATVIDRDDGRCQGCHRRVEGRNATIDHKNPEGPETLDNLHLLCQSCNAIKGKHSWEDFQPHIAQLVEKQNTRPDFICKNTGLSVRGRTWREAGCNSPSACLGEGECIDLDAVMICPCHHYGCPPDCPGCSFCEHDRDSAPPTIICGYFDTPFAPCVTPSDCRDARGCVRVAGGDFGDA